MGGGERSKGKAAARGVKNFSGERKAWFWIGNEMGLGFHVQEEKEEEERREVLLLRGVVAPTNRYLVQPTVTAMALAFADKENL